MLYLATKGEAREVLDILEIEDIVAPRRDPGALRDP